MERTRAKGDGGRGKVVAGERASGMVSGGVAGGGWLVGGGGRETRRICRTRATRSECCPARKNGYSFSNVPDAHARFPAKRMAGVRSGGERVRGRGVGGGGGGGGAGDGAWCGGEEGWLVVKRQEGERSELTGR